MSNASFGKSLKSGGAIGTDKLENILKVYRDINIEWLLTGVGAMIKPEITEEVKPLICQEPSIGVPYYDVDFIGGFEVVINDQTIVPTHNIVFEPFKEADFWCNATGNSMAEKINHGDVIALKKVDSVDDILFGEIYAVVLEKQKDNKNITQVERSYKAAVYSCKHHGLRRTGISNIPDTKNLRRSWVNQKVFLNILIYKL